MKKTIVAMMVAFTTATLFAGGAKESSSAARSVSDGFVYDGTGRITDKEGQHISELAQNSNYTTVDLRKAEIVQRVQQEANVTVDWTLIDPTNYKDAISPMLAAGNDLPDIVLLPNLDENQQYIQSGMFEPLDTHFDEMPNYARWLDNNPVVKASLTASDGHIYYVPVINVTNNYQPVLMYNMKWLEKAGKTVPTNLDEFVDLLRYYKSHDMNGNGKQDEIPMSMMAEFLPYTFGPAFGLNFTSEQGSGFFAEDSGKVVYAQATKEYKDYLTFLNSLYKEGLLEVEYTTLTRDQIIERFANDKTGITFDYGWQSSMTYSKQLPYYDGSAATGVVLQRPLDGPIHKGFYVGRNPVGSVYGVTASSGRKDLAIRFLDCATKDSNQDMYIWGIEGKSYTVDAQGKRHFTEQARDNTWLQSLGINPAQVFPAHQSVASTNELVAPWHAEQDQALEKYIKSPWPFIYSTEDEASIVSMYMVDIQTYVDEMAVSFVNGTTPLSDYDSYVTALNKLNLPEVLKVRQAQYDRYQKTMRK